MYRTALTLLTLFAVVTADSYDSSINPHHLSTVCSHYSATKNESYDLTQLAISGYIPEGTFNKQPVTIGVCHNLICPETGGLGSSCWHDQLGNSRTGFDLGFHLSISTYDLPRSYNSSGFVLHIEDQSYYSCGGQGNSNFRIYYICDPAAMGYVSRFKILSGYTSYNLDCDLQLVATVKTKYACPVDGNVESCSKDCTADYECGGHCGKCHFNQFVKNGQCVSG